MLGTDWFDGLDTFMRYICHRSWLGGWLLPQSKSYFALQLPHGWWVFGLDQALHGDIDIFQFKYFTEIVREHVSSSYFLRQILEILTLMVTNSLYHPIASSWVLFNEFLYIR